MPDSDGRGAALARSRMERFDAWFKDRRWRVRTEVTEVREKDGSSVVYDHGEFWVRPPEKFRTPFGNEGRHGFLIREVDPATGRDLDPAVDVAFGHILLVSAVQRYGAIRDLPAEQRKIPPPAPTG
jgi:hypothetical protein